MSELEDVSVESLKTKKLREKWLWDGGVGGGQNRLFKDHGSTTKGTTYTSWDYYKEKKERKV